MLIRGKKLIVITIEVNLQNHKMSKFSIGTTYNKKRKLLWCDNVCLEEGLSDDDNYFVLNIRIVYDDSGLETKSLVKFKINGKAFVNLNFSVASASPVSF